ncbi:hypothetical protein GCM10025782_35060 [Pedococcus ginsenosidimutans]|uniref:Uncharacterized protein n=1 Tax=Pedococcus ginsenosidimutans TaxID=490570 RepID=A0ABP8YLY3_9MICO
MNRLVTTIVGLGAVAALAACSGGSGGSADTTVQASRPASSSNAPSGSGSSSSSAGAAAELPDGFPLPDGAKAQGDAVQSDTLTIADYTVPDGKKAYDGLVTALPGAGWAVSAKSWSDSLGSGTITASGNGTEVKLLVLDKDLSLSIKKS